jgi:serine/threonine protein kinase
MSLSIRPGCLSSLGGGGRGTLGGLAKIRRFARPNVRLGIECAHDFSDENPMDSKLQLQIGQDVGACRIVRKIGEGGMGEVYEGWEESLQRKVAIKILSESALASAEMVERFRGEGRALAKVKHRNVVSLYSLGEVNGRAYMAMEYVDGLPVNKYFERHPCALKDTLELFRQMAEGLACAHEANVIHRDIKPGNIIVDQSLTCKIIDFGIAKMHSDHSTVNTAQDIVMGTANYLAPEVVMGRTSTLLSDVYSLGLVYYSILTGEIPFNGHSNLETLEKIRSSTLTFNPRFNIVIPEEVRRIIFRMTSKSPNMRFQSAREVANELSNVDLEDWPKDFLTPVYPRIELENREEVQAQCEKHGFALPETRIIINLAVSLEEAQSADKTAPVYIAPLVRLKGRSVDEAIARFNSAKSLLVSRRMEISRLAQLAPRNHSRQKIVWPALGGLAALCAIYFTHALKHQPSSFAPARDPMNRTELASIAPDKNGPKMPQYKNGDSFQTRLTLNENGKPPAQYDETWLFAGDQPGVTQWQSAKGAQAIFDQEFYLPPVKIRGAEMTMDFDSKVTGERHSLFPLTVGLEVKNAMELSTARTNEKHKFDWTCGVVSRDKSNTKAGAFDVYKIVCKADRGPFVEETLVYAPALRHWLTRDVVLRDWSIKAHYDLVGYELGK